MKSARMSLLKMLDVVLGKDINMSRINKKCRSICDLPSMCVLVGFFSIMNVCIVCTGGTVAIMFTIMSDLVREEHSALASGVVCLACGSAMIIGNSSSGTWDHVAQCIMQLDSI